ncbi:SMR domain-containing protein At5g58720 isoform X2 [Diospyros lotus]|uniref:SMR domain-containing protein At5g58720 isoform X2 n=1 Tax=Diospyros lotus TaxID=55363 RepID=UPI00224F6F71|nr:SMR domain-containing protein At5g58720 isoform X2 [Diospyros lotus]
MKHSRKKKKSRASSQVGAKGAAPKEERGERKAVKGLSEALTSVSLDEATSAYGEANGVEILGVLAESIDDQAASCSSSSVGDGPMPGSGLSSVEVLEANRARNGVHGRVSRGTKQKKVIAATGTVSTVLRKEYVMSSPRKDSFRSARYINTPASKGEAEQFLCSMLGNDCELSMAVVRDVLCQYRYDVEKALNALLELTASSYGPSKKNQSYEHTANTKAHGGSIIKWGDNITDRASDSTSHSSESENHDNIWCMGNDFRNYSEVLLSSEVDSFPGLTSSESEVSQLPQKVLESLFNMPNISEHEPATMNWRDVVKKMQSLGQRFGFDPADAVEPDHADAKGDEYVVFRKAAREQWDSMKSCYQKAATAFSNGERGYAAYLSDQGRLHNKMAQEADKKASQQIFRARNKRIENVITIDLHGQHVKQATRLLKIHLLFGAYARSVQMFRIITGCGSHGVGKSKLKQSVIKLIEREGIEWREENQGTILIKLDEQREFTFLGSGSDSE